MDIRRRRILEAGLGAAALFAPSPFARLWAQTEGTLKLLRVPKVALVVGNSKYKDAPLKNPVNDARAIGAALATAGFSVTSALDATKAQMAAAIEAYLREVAAKKAAALFYYAGHGVQLAWRNYMLPLDADIDTIEDVQKQAVEVNSVMEGLAKAANPLNVVILDACRDNPFGKVKPQQRGLSQMDAPNHTILAYATSPGNVASDGDGANGLYTENLLAEMKVAEAKIEDVFKRVRLGVRRRSNGAQIPWESTSLEDDFYFLPPAQLKKRSEDEIAAAFRQELALWESIRSSAEPGPLEDYLRRYPSGQFTELAQLQLDRVLARKGEKKIEIAASEGNPFTKGSATANTAYRVGDSYSYVEMDVFSKAEQRRYTRTVTQITDDTVVYDSGLVTDLLGNPRVAPGGNRLSPNQNTPLEFVVGRHWESRFVITVPKGEIDTALQFRIVARESITVPAGTFNAFRVEWSGSQRLFGGSGGVRGKAWFDPTRVRQPLAREQIREVRGNYLEASRIELLAFRQG